MRAIRVVCTEHSGRLKLGVDQLAQIGAVSPVVEVEYIAYRDKPALQRALSDAEVLYSMGGNFDPSWAPKLRWIQLYTAGFDHLVDAPLRKRGVTITTTRGIHGYPMAEFVFGLIFSITRQLPKIFRLQQQRSWEKHVWLEVLGSEVRDKTLGIVGYGHIGQEVARAGRCFGMHVLGLRRTAGPGDESSDGLADKILNGERLHDVLALSDFVVVTLPLTSETTNIIDEAALRSMRPSAWLINVARGAIIEEQALLRALREGWIAGAALDAFVTEPLPPNSEFYELPNVIITPHVAAGTDRYEERALGVFLENLRRYLAGEPLLNVVDFGRAY